MEEKDLFTLATVFGAASVVLVITLTKIRKEEKTILARVTGNSNVQ